MGSRRSPTARRRSGSSPAGPGGGGLQHRRWRRGSAAAARPRGAPPGVRRPGRAPRGAAHGLPHGGGRPVRRVLPVGHERRRSVRWRSRTRPGGAAESWWRSWRRRPGGRSTSRRGPLVRLRLRCGPGRRTGHVLLLAVHHMVADFWSLAVIARELAALYREPGCPAAADRAATRPLTPTSCAGRRSGWPGRAGSALWAYWRQRWPAAAGPRPADRPARGRRCRPGLPRRAAGCAGRAAAAALARWRRGRGATLFTALLAGFQALLARYAGQEDFAVGAPRPDAALAGVAGRGRLLRQPGRPARPTSAGDPGFGELLERTRRTALGALEHADLPFPRLAERLRPVRDPGPVAALPGHVVLQQGATGEPAALAGVRAGRGGGAPRSRRPGA